MQQKRKKSLQCHFSTIYKSIKNWNIYFYESVSRIDFRSAFSKRSWSIFLHRLRFKNCLRISLSIFSFRFLTKGSLIHNGYDVEILFTELKYSRRYLRKNLKNWTYYVLELKYIANGLVVFQIVAFRWANIVVIQKKIFFYSSTKRYWRVCSSIIRFRETRKKLRLLRFGNELFIRKYYDNTRENDFFEIR